MPGHELTTSMICSLGLWMDTTRTPSRDEPRTCAQHTLFRRPLVVWAGERLGEASELMELRTAQRLGEPARRGGNLGIDASEHREPCPRDCCDRATPVVGVQAPLRESQPHEAVEHARHVW